MSYTKAYAYMPSEKIEGYKLDLKKSPILYLNCKNISIW